jgi:hypothetical protein
MTCNVSVSNKLVNGALGTVHGFLYEETRKYIKSNSRPSNTGEQQPRNKINIKDTKTTPIKRHTSEFLLNIKTIKCFRTQFPFTLSAALSYHKTQGYTLDKVI